MKLWIISVSLTIASCGDSSFRGQSTSAETKEEDALPEVSSYSAREIKPVFKNARRASPQKNGLVEVQFKMQNMRPTDKNIAIKFVTHSTDFTDIKSEPISGDHPNLQINLSFEYRYVPDVTMYREQTFRWSYTTEDGEQSEELTYGVLITDPDKGNDPKTILEGKEGHPEVP